MTENNTQATAKADPHHILGFGFLSYIWLALLFLTAITVLAAQVDFGFFNVIIAMLIATSKALLVVLFFMHLGYENRTFQFFVFFTFLILAIFISFTFFDVAYR